MARGSSPNHLSSAVPKSGRRRFSLKGQTESGSPPKDRTQAPTVKQTNNEKAQPRGSRPTAPVPYQGDATNATQVGSHVDPNPPRKLDCDKRSFNTQSQRASLPLATEPQVPYCTAGTASCRDTSTPAPSKNNEVCHMKGNLPDELNLRIQQTDHLNKAEEEKRRLERVERERKTKEENQRIEEEKQKQKEQREQSQSSKPIKMEEKEPYRHYQNVLNLTKDRPVPNGLRLPPPIYFSRISATEHSIQKAVSSASLTCSAHLNLNA